MPLAELSRNGFASLAALGHDDDSRAGFTFAILAVTLARLEVAIKVTAAILASR
jgi:hypothetical protein